MIHKISYILGLFWVGFFKKLLQRKIIFIGLKVLETFGIPALYSIGYFFAPIVAKISTFTEGPCGPFVRPAFWSTEAFVLYASSLMFFLVILFLVILATALIINIPILFKRWIKANWDYAGKLCNSSTRKV